MAADSEVSRGRKTLLLHAHADDQLLGLHSQAHPWGQLMLLIFSHRSLLLRYIMAMVVVVGRGGGTWQAVAHAEEHCPSPENLSPRFTYLRAMTNRITELLISETLFLFRDSLL